MSKGSAAERLAAEGRREGSARPTSEQPLVAPETMRALFGAALIEAGPQPLPGAFAPIVSAIIDDLVAFAVADAAGRKASARAALDAARMRLEELCGRYAPPQKAAP